MFNADGKLDIFEEFQVDHDLPKYARRRERARMAQANLGVAHPAGLNVMNGGARRGDGFNQDFALNWSPGDSMMDQTTIRVATSGRRRATRDIGNALSQRPRSGFWHRIFGRKQTAPSVLLDGQHEDAPLEMESQISVEEFFKLVGGSTEQLQTPDVIAQRAAGYVKLLDQAKQSGQRALWERLAAGLEATKAETQLLALGQTRYVTEPVIVEFVKKAPKGLRLDWIANYTQPVPADVLTTKLRCDDHECFDNYVVLHYDPARKSWAETEAQKARRKDPILFGLIQGSRHLYYVGDWVNEFCDLTLDKLAEVLGREPTQQIPVEVQL